MIGKLIFADYPFGDFKYEWGQPPNMEYPWWVVCPDKEPCKGGKAKKWSVISKRTTDTKQCEAGSK